MDIEPSRLVDQIKRYSSHEQTEEDFHGPLWFYFMDRYKFGRKLEEVVTELLLGDYSKDITVFTPGFRQAGRIISYVQQYSTDFVKAVPNSKITSCNLTNLTLKVNGLERRLQCLPSRNQYLYDMKGDLVICYMTHVYPLEIRNYFFRLPYEDSKVRIIHWDWINSERFYR